MAPTQPIKAEQQVPLTASVASIQSFNMENEILNATQAAVIKLQTEARNFEARATNLQVAAKDLQDRAANLRAAAARLQAAAATLTRAPAPTADTSCALLELPAEMRNRIYRYALVNQDCVVIQLEDCAQPGLLRTCRQIRTEALAIFYSENKFELDACLPVPTGGLPQMQHWLWKMPVREEFDVWANDNVPWEPFKHWLQLIHRGAIHVANFLTEDYAEEILNQALSIVKDYRGLPWSVAAYQLEDFRRKKGANPRAMCPSKLWG